jgi:hypothetical protein
MPEDHYLSHLDTLASNLDNDGQHEEALGVANRCLQIDPAHLACLSRKASALYSLGRFQDAKSIIEHSLALGAVTELDVLAQKTLRKLRASINAAQNDKRNSNVGDRVALRSAAPQIPPGVSGTVTCSPRGVSTNIDINGELDATTVESVRKLFEEYHEQQTKWKAGQCDGVKQKGLDYGGFERFSINSRGGSVAAAMAIGRMLREEQKHVIVDGVCISSCVLVLAGAVDRQISDAAVIGIHRPYFVPSAGQTISSEEVSSAYNIMLKNIRAYFGEMGISKRLADDMLATEPENVHVLTREELDKYGLSRLDPTEQQRRATANEVLDLKTSNQLGLDRLEYNRRKALGDRLCPYTSESSYSEVSDCKQRVLTTGR